MIGHGRPTISAALAACVWLAGAHWLAAEEVAAPVDSLRIVTTRDALIFAPREQFTFDVQPQLAGVEPSTTIDIATTLAPAGGGSPIWNTQQRLPVPVDGQAIATLHVPLPAQEGVYEIRLSVSRPPGFRERFFPGGAAAPLVERKFQVVVLDHLPPAPAVDAKWQAVLDIDPANPTWSARLPDWTQIRRLPGLSRRPIGSVHAATVALPQGVFVELPPTPPAGEPHWQAYPLTIEAVGAPHLLEVEYPNDRDQHLGISIVEADAQGRFVTIGRDSGVYVEGLGAHEHVGTEKHQLLFWPRTSAPLVLVTNQHPTASARFGHIHVLRHTSGTIAREPWATSPPTGRIVAAYLARPLHGERSDTPYDANEWRAFYDGAEQLADYLNYAGYNAAAINILGEGSELVPDRLLHAARPADIRPLGVEADLPAADGLELLLRVFDRSGLALLPMLDLTIPLPELESLRQRVDSRVEGIELVGPGGATWHEAHPDASGGAVRYNLLSDRVQQAVLDVARQSVARYGAHPAFHSLAVQLSSRGSGVLGDLEWGIDDATVARFEHETGAQLSASGPDRFAVRQQLLTGEHAAEWRDWRAAQVTRFYQQLAGVVASSGGHRSLVLTTEELLAAGDAAAKVRPSVVGKPRLDRTMLDLGIDWHALAGTPGIVVLPTRYVESMVPLVDRAVDLTLNDGFAAVDKTSAAALLYHRPQRQSLASLDALSGSAAHRSLRTQSVAYGAAARQPYVTALVESDPLLVMDGGELPPLGQEDAVRRLRSVLKALPPTSPVSARREQNVAVRTYVDRGQTICLLVNECPWPSDVTLDVVAAQPASAVPLVADDGPAAATQTDRFAAGRQVWSLQLAPYDVHAVRFVGSNVEIQHVQAQVSDAGRQELAARVAELTSRDLTATPHYTALVNPGCEPGGGNGQLRGWEMIGNPVEVQADFDTLQPQAGQTCLRLENSGTGTATIASEPFATPPTGQLGMWVFVRGENLAPGSELRMVFEVEGSPTSYRQATAAVPVTAEWGRGFAFGREDLPLSSRSRMRIKFELSGPGKIWIDNVQLFNLLFPLDFYGRSGPEKLELVKMMSDTDKALENGELAECVRKLNGYWPRFVNAYSPATAPAIATRPLPQDAAPPANEQQEDTPSVGSRWFSWPGFLSR